MKLSMPHGRCKVDLLGLVNDVATSWLKGADRVLTTIYKGMLGTNTTI